MHGAGGGSKRVKRTDAAANDVRVKFSDYVNRVAFGNERVVVRRHRDAIAALVSIDDLNLLEALDATALPTEAA